MLILKVSQNHLIIRVIAQTMRNVKIILFAVMDTRLFGVMNILYLLYLTKLAMVKIPLTSLLMIQ